MNSLRHLLANSFTRINQGFIQSRNVFPTKCKSVFWAGILWLEVISYLVSFWRSSSEKLEDPETEIPKKADIMIRNKREIKNEKKWSSQMISVGLPEVEIWLLDDLFETQLILWCIVETVGQIKHNPNWLRLLSISLRRTDL